MTPSESRPATPLRTARKEQELTLATVAERAGISVSYVSMIESGYVPPAPIRTVLAKAVDRPEASLWPE